jgi:hypothetical protein
MQEPQPPDLAHFWHAPPLSLAESSVEPSSLAEPSSAPDLPPLPEFPVARPPHEARQIAIISTTTRLMYVSVWSRGASVNKDFSVLGNVTQGSPPFVNAR